jgi:hypothetical protein
MAFNTPQTNSLRYKNLFSSGFSGAFRAKLRRKSIA